MTTVNSTSLLRVGVSSSGRASGSFDGDVTADGRYIAFRSNGAGLVPDGPSTGDFYHVYVRDVQTGTVQLVSRAMNGNPATAGGGNPQISDDGHYVAFISDDTSLVPNELPDGVDSIYIRDLWSASTFKVPIPGSEGDAEPISINFSGEGRFITFDYKFNIYRHDLITGTTVQASVSNVASTPNGTSLFSDISSDGRFIVFQSEATNMRDLDGGDSNGVTDIFVRDVETQNTSLVSVTNSDVESNGYSSDASISADGRYVAFTSAATNLVGGDTNGKLDIFVRDTLAGTTKLVSSKADGTFGDGDSNYADISTDGRYVVFESYADNLVAGDFNGASDVFVRDMVAGTLTRVSVNYRGGDGNAGSSDAHISDDGRYVTFTSSASNLIPGDTNGTSDLFRISLFASDAADNLIGSDGADSISGLGGADIIRGGLGADTMIGGAASDLYYVDDANDRIVEGVAEGNSDQVVTSVSYTLRAGVYVETVAAQDLLIGSPIDLTGNELVQTLNGNNAANRLLGLGGNDTIFGGAGNDTIDGGTGADRMMGGSGDDLYAVDVVGDVVVEAGSEGTDSVQASISYTLGANLEKLTLTGTSAINGTGNLLANTITGNSAANTLRGGDGNDTISGGSGADTLIGGVGNDNYVVDNVGDVVIELSTEGSDLVTASLTYTLSDNVENLILTGTAGIKGTGNALSNALTGNAGNNILTGLAGDDQISGAAGNDTLVGGIGNDVLNGGAGNDEFLFNAVLGTSNIDTLVDFFNVTLNDDTIRLENAIFTKLTSTGALDAAFFTANVDGAAKDANDYIVYETDTGRLLYDADGTGAGAAVQFATVANLATLTTGDFVVV